jgi:hypothetical protein
MIGDEFIRGWKWQTVVRLEEGVWGGLGDVSLLLGFLLFGRRIFFLLLFHLLDDLFNGGHLSAAKK